MQRRVYAANPGSIHPTDPTINVHGLGLRLAQIFRRGLRDWDWSVHARYRGSYGYRGGKKRWPEGDTRSYNDRGTCATYGKPFHARFSTYRVTILPTGGPILTTMTTTVNAHYNGFMLLIRTHWAGFE